MLCTVCQTELGPPLYVASTDHALTSLCECRPGQVRVWQCPTCTHLCGEPMPDTRDYYETEYRILLDHDDEDQIYETHGEHIVYRTDHQVATLLAKLSLPSGAKLLDYGCAKASTPRRLLASRQDIQVNLFDVSAMYTRLWQQFLPSERWAIHDTPKDWRHEFDVVTSFFALEHIPTPLDTVRRIANLLHDKGVFYGIVPDTFGNIADFVVIDHVNHFTATSLHRLLRTAGFAEIQIDEKAHRGALVFTARKNGNETPTPDSSASRQRANQLAHYWAQLDNRIQTAEAAHVGTPAAIYGSGFYGSYIANTLRFPGQIRCFLDASPYQQGKTLFSYPILPPSDLPKLVRVIYIGLNPKIARTEVAKMEWLRGRDLKLVYLDEITP